MGIQKYCKILNKNTSTYFHSALLVIWPLTMLKRTHFSKLSTSRFTAQKRRTFSYIFTMTPITHLMIISQPELGLPVLWLAEFLLVLTYDLLEDRCIDDITINPLIPRISLVILLTVCHTVLEMLVWRIWDWINLII